MKKFVMSLVVVLFLVVNVGSAFAAESLTCWFPPSWKSKAENARAIALALTEESGVSIRPRIAKSYPEILSAFSTGDANLVYVGSFVQAIVKARKLGTPLVQAVTGKELYGGILIYPKGGNPEAILAQNPEQIAFAIGASSGESVAKAATAGKASIGVANHGIACGAVKAGKAKAAVVKNWWWDANSSKFPELDTYEIPTFSKAENPDNVLTASNGVPLDVRNKIASAAIKRVDVFGAMSMKPLDSSRLIFSLWLMEQGKIDPLTYSW